MNSSRFNHRILLFFIILFLSFSCQKPFVQEEIRTFANHTWNRFDILELNAGLEKNDHLTDILVVFEHTIDYPNDYIDLNFTMYLPEGGMRTRDYMFELKDSEGVWLGKQMDGLFRVELPVIQGMTIAEDGNYKIRIENKLTKFNTPGVTAVGYKIQKSRKQR